MDFDSESIAALAADMGDELSGARLHGAMVGGLCGGGADAGVWEPVLEAARGGPASEQVMADSPLVPT